MSHLNDTIVSIITALQEAAISVVRMSGSDAIDIADKLFTRDIQSQPSHTVKYGHIKDPLTDQIIDEVLCTVYRAPKTYTKEDIVEISCHGGVLVTQKVLELCLTNGARMAQPGEFTQRAYLNGRIDLTQAESVMDLIQSENEFARELAISGVQGQIKDLIQPFLDRLLEIIATIEVNIDYPEYDDVEMLTQQSVYPRVNALLADLETILKKSRSGRILKEGVKTVILGKPNVGKSSILNELLQEDKAIVTDVAGTTRDLVEGWIKLEHVALHLIDTAGLRDTHDTVEKIGIQRSRKALEDAELVLIVFDASKPLDDEDKALLEETKNKERLIIYNKTDLIHPVLEEGIAVSALNHDVKDLVDAINTLYVEHQIALKQPTLSNRRHIAQVAASLTAMKRAQKALEMGIELDLVTLDLNESYTELASVIMQKQDINILDEIFSRFCLGK
ncbi:tRNA modification GTPase MnmE [Erysipelothrix larvae]|uniref:tRNA modification GTPase MnmE n=1 Tax=Erysipelothrix larvae TaxID=1514105 RepID=A0A0X8GYD1_9FIRM|nr:tRNA uridine-5-carboxymethylaminomethyl(34) synthesis GTPase MnmE [Erysipelothrix larvae]AMC92459.1 tRNA modification GTPase MnmE [Erysipelothrix larvae]